MELQLRVLDRTLTMDLPNAMVIFPYSTVPCDALKRERFCPSAFLNGGRIYLDGCFMRKENYTFYDQYLGPEDRHVCGNRTTKSTLFP
ncbi:hypothetical protein CQW23_24106 [Capsicum baccatum]|uniref:Uncharacterized protein n=1 Tax=Capsicum baccatum TaxID=33114 RepID=A0A2G2VTW2_CAPBA|nr:hypothetical protein CQW23_24106 [Capsicum baccatum]